MTVGASVAMLVPSIPHHYLLTDSDRHQSFASQPIITMTFTSANTTAAAATNCSRIGFSYVIARLGWAEMVLPTAAV